MSEAKPDQIPDGVDPQKPEQPPAPAPRRRRRRWPYVIAALLVLLIALVALLPTIVSTPWGRSVVVAQANRFVKGRVELSDLSVGWTSGIHVAGLRIFEDEAQVLEMAKLDSGLTLLDLLFDERIDLDDVRLEGASFVLRIYPDGTTNFHRIFNIKPSTGPLVLPDISGSIAADFRGTVEQAGADGKPRVTHIDSASIKASFPTINAPIDHDIRLALRPADGPAGTVRAAGKMRLFTNNALDPARIAGNETVDVESLQLAGLRPFIPPSAGVEQIAGNATAHLVMQLAGEGPQYVEGLVKAAGAALGGSILSGDTWRSDALTINIPRTSFDPATGRIATAQPILLTTDQGTIRLTADAAMASLQRLAQNLEPQHKGKVVLTVEADAAKLAAQLPHLLSIKDKVKLASGEFKHETVLEMEPGSALVRTVTTVAKVAGTDDKGNPITLQPIVVRAETRSLGGGGAIPQLADLSLNVQGGDWAKIEGGGKTLSSIKVAGGADLAKARSELGQFVAFGEVQMRGRLDISAGTEGDLSKPDGTANLNVTLTGTDLDIAGVMEKPIAEPWMQAAVTGKLVRGKGMFVSAINGVVATVKTGKAEQPAIAARALADVAFVQRPGPDGAPATFIDVPTLKLEEVRLDLPAARSTLAALLPQLESMGLSFTQGAVAVTMQGSYRDRVLSAEKLTIAGQKLAFTRNQGQFGPADIQLNAAARLSPDELSLSALDGALAVATVKLVEPIVIDNLRGPGVVRAKGAVRVEGQVRDVLQFVQAIQGASPGEAPAYAGRFDITQGVRSDAANIVLKGKGNIADFVVGDPSAPSFTEKLIEIDNDVWVDTKAQVVNIQGASLAMQSSGAVAASLKGGIRDYANQRFLDNMRLSLSYDAAKVWQIVTPMLAQSTRDSLKPLQVAGVVRDREFIIGGRYPAAPVQGAKRERDPLEMVTVHGGLSIEQFAYGDMRGQRLEIPITFAAGKLLTVYGNKPEAERFAAPAPFSGGTIDLSGLEVSVLANRMRVTALRPGQKLLDNVRITEAFAREFLGGVHPLFTGADKARGVVTLTIDKLDALPIDDGLTKANVKGGIGEFTLNITDFAIANPFSQLFARSLKMQVAQDGTVAGKIENAKFRLEPGRAYSTVVLDLGGQVLGFTNGEVDLGKSQIVAMQMLVPEAMFRKVVPANVAPLLRAPDVPGQAKAFAVPVKGSMAAPMLDIDGVVKQFLKPDKLLQPGGLIDLIDPKKDKKEDEKPPGTISRPRRRE